MVHRITFQPSIPFVKRQQNRPPAATPSIQTDRIQFGIGNGIDSCMEFILKIADLKVPENLQEWIVSYTFPTDRKELLVSVLPDRIEPLKEMLLQQRILRWSKGKFIFGLNLEVLFETQTKPHIPPLPPMPDSP